MLDRILFFPVTPFTREDTVDRVALGDHIAQGLEHRPGGIFAACGTGEFHALGQTDYATVVETSAAVIGGRTPLFVGAGGPLPAAIEQVQVAERAGATGILLLPPYLTVGPDAGLVEYVRRVASATSLPIIAYHRGTARFTEATTLEIARIPNVIGLKDGVGEIDVITRIIRAVRDSDVPGAADFQFFNGLPTAEIAQVAYRAIGVPLYSSASFAFAPDIALAYFAAVENEDTATIAALDAAFFHPLVRLRNVVPGYAVSLIKAGVTRFTGVDAGHVRPPLVDALPEHADHLEQLVSDARRVLADSFVAAR
ncbi:5-dehydro-4-deoxyglucarate dehydratase [Microbacterium sp. 1P06AB]|uniref:5-dehydro-4-deoxyglucarate dehydratase n=1 Tax=Microbacterium sp. 1P06AB TaxID=3132289 RepID=UPI0039A713C2